MMRITQDFLNHLSPVELSFIRTGIDKLYKEKVTPDTTNYENIESHVQRCPHCGSVHFVKNGFNPKHNRNTDARTAVQYSWQLQVPCLHIQEQVLIHGLLL